MSFIRLDFVRCESGLLISLFSKGDLFFFESLSNNTGHLGSCKAGCVKGTDGGKQKVVLVKLWLLFT